MATQTDARFILSADDRTKAAIRSVQTGLKGLQGHVTSLGRSINSYGYTLLSVAGAGGLAVFIKRQLEAADEAGKMAQKFGTTAEVISTTAFAAEQAGVSIEEIGKASVKLAKNMSAARDGTGDAKDAFADLDIQVANSQGVLRNTDDVMLEVADRFKGLEDGAEKTALAVQIFGRSGAELIPFLNLGAQGIQELRQQARELGLEVSTNTAIQAGELSDRFDVLKKSASGVAMGIAVDLLPGLIDAVKAIDAARRESGFLTAVWVALGAAGNAIFNSSLERQIADIDEKIKNLSAASGKFSLAYPDKGFKTDYSKKINDLIFERKALLDHLAVQEEQEKKRAAEREAQLKREAEAREKATAAMRKAAEDRALREDADKAADAQLKAAVAAREAQARQESDAIRNLQQQIVLLGATTEKEKVLAEIRFGSYSKFPQATQQRLMALAQEKDATQAQIDAEESLKKAQEDKAEEWRKQVEDMAAARVKLDEEEASTIRNLEKQIALTGDMSNEERTLVEIRMGAYSRYSAANQQRLVELARELDAAEQAASKSQNTLSVFAEQAGRNIQNILAQHFEQGFDGILRNFGDMLKQMIAQAAAAQLLGQLGAWGKGSESGFGQFIGAMFGGTRDSGGRGYPGMAYAIGTGAQPEIFMPDRPGTFVPRNQQGGMGATYNINVSVPMGTPQEVRRAFGAGSRQVAAAIRNTQRYT